jgi:hypothetical protein
MVIARITFKEETANYWIDQDPKSDKIRTVIELAYETPAALVAQLKEIEDAIVECVAIVNGQILALSDFMV